MDKSNFLIKNVLLFKDNKLIPRDILIQNGLIKSIKKKISFSPSDVECIEGNGMILSSGLSDIHVHLRDFEQDYKETIKTGTLAAARGGFTKIGAMPNTQPPLDNIEMINRFQKKCKDNACVSVFPIPAMTVGSKGKELCNYNEYSKNGIFAITDDGRGVEDDSLMEEIFKKASEYNFVVMQHAEFSKLSNHGALHNGKASLKFGLNGISSESEYKMVERDCKLAKKYGAHLHVQHISAKETVDIINDYKNQGVNVTCEVTPHHLVLDEESILSDHGNYKMNPPLRSVKDRSALIEGAASGVIDIIATDHAPHSNKEKSMGIEKSPFGIIGLETAFPVIYSLLVKKRELPLEKLLEMLTQNVDKIFKLETCLFNEGDVADMVLIDLNKELIVSKDSFKSKSSNTPFSGLALSGWPILTLSSGRTVWSER